MFHWIQLFSSFLFFFLKKVRGGRGDCKKEMKGKRGLCWMSKFCTDELRWSFIIFLLLSSLSLSLSFFLLLPFTFFKFVTFRRFIAKFEISFLAKYYFLREREKGGKKATCFSFCAFIWSLFMRRVIKYSSTGFICMGSMACYVFLRQNPIKDVIT